MVYSRTGPKKNYYTLDNCSRGIVAEGVCCKVRASMRASSLVFALCYSYACYSCCWLKPLLLAGAAAAPSRGSPSAAKSRTQYGASMAVGI